MKRLKRALDLAGAALLTISSTSAVSHCAPAAVEQSRSQCTYSFEALFQTASQVNELLPMMADSETEVFNTTADHCTFIYNYRLVNISRDDVSDNELRDLQREMQDQVTNMACSTPDTRRDFLDAGVTLSYVYHDQESRRMMTVDVEPEDCPGGH